MDRTVISTFFSVNYLQFVHTTDYKIVSIVSHQKSMSDNWVMTGPPYGQVNKMFLRNSQSIG